MEYGQKVDVRPAREEALGIGKTLVVFATTAYVCVSGIYGMGIGSVPGTLQMEPREQMISCERPCLAIERAGASAKEAFLEAERWNPFPAVEKEERTHKSKPEAVDRAVRPAVAGKAPETVEIIPVMPTLVNPKGQANRMETVCPPKEKEETMEMEQAPAPVPVPEEQKYTAVDGFLVDDSGMIRGIDDFAVASEGCLAFPETGCRGIGKDAFLNAPEGILEVYIPANIVEIEEGAFIGLSDCEWFEVDTENRMFFSQEGVLFSDEGTCLLAFPSGRTGGYPVPQTVQRLADHAFWEARLNWLDTRKAVLEDCGNLPESIGLK